MNTTITALPTAGGIDGAADWLAIDTASPSSTNKISRNILLGITSQPLGLTDTQSPTNKTLGNTNTVTLKDTLFTLQDDSDTTKQARFQLSGITTATTRTYTLPNVTDTLVSLTASQTLTNKTLTAPAITGGTIDNTTITVDSIAGHTTPTIVTVANLQISNGVLNSANAVTATSIADGAIQPKALTSGTGSGWAMQSWTPTFANFTKGNAVITSVYIQIGKSVFFHLEVVLGSTSTMGTAPTFTLPVTATSRTVNFPLGSTVILDASAGSLNAFSTWTTTGTGKLLYWDTSNAGQNVTASAPMSWTTNDSFSINGTYEAA